jgi:hypothetical protein
MVFIKIAKKNPEKLAGKLEKFMNFSPKLQKYDNISISSTP